MRYARMNDLRPMARSRDDAHLYDAYRDWRLEWWKVAGELLIGNPSKTDRGMTVDKIESFVILFFT